MNHDQISHLKEGIILIENVVGSIFGTSKLLSNEVGIWSRFLFIRNKNQKVRQINLPPITKPTSLQFKKAVKPPKIYSKYPHAIVKNINAPKSTVNAFLQARNVEIIAVVWDAKI